MRRSASIVLLALLAACGAHVDASDGAPGSSSGKAPTASSIAAAPRVVARDLNEGYCGTFYSYCPMFVLSDRVFFRAMTSPDATSLFVATIRSARVSDDDATAATLAHADDASNLLGPFLGGDGVEWLVQSDDASATTLFTGRGTNADARELATIDGVALVAADDALAIYLFMSDGALVRVSKSNGAARVVGALDGFVPIAAVADADADGFLYATGGGGIARVSKSSALLTTLSTSASMSGSELGDRLSVGAGELFAAEESPSSSTILARALGGGAARTVASSDGGSSSIVVDGDDVYWIAVSGEGADVSSAVWRAPLDGSGSPARLYAEGARSSWLTGVAFDATSIYMTTSDGRLLALAK